MEREPSGEEPGPSSSPPKSPPGLLHRAQLESKEIEAKEEREHRSQRISMLDSEKKAAIVERQRLRHRLSMPEWDSGTDSDDSDPPETVYRRQPFTKNLHHRLWKLESEKKTAEEECERLRHRLSMPKWASTGTVYRPPPSWDLSDTFSELRDLHHRLWKLESEKKTAEEECERLRRRLLMLELEKKAAKEKEECERRTERARLESNPMRKRSSSLDWLPPDLSELRVVLLGNSSSERRKVKDLLLSASEGVTETSSRDCWKYEFKIEEKDIHVINPKDLLCPDVSQAEVEEDVQTAQRLSAPGAHVLLLVLQPEDFTEDQKEKLCSVLRLFGERSFDHSLILISTPREESPGFMEIRKHPPLKDLIRMCKYRYLWFKDLEVEELLTRFDQVVKENDGEHLKP